ncbi:MAG: peptidoglycan glycosyltransferase [Lachnospiraceae bacterium]|nr:peptidoglycan glycosyltransferase [Lachnospiraceae bacterium]
MFALLISRCAYLMIAKADYYTEMADDLHYRERTIKAARGLIYDRNGTIIAANKAVCTVSVIYNQMTDREKVIEILCRELEMDEDRVRGLVEKYSSREIIKTNVDLEIGERIRAYNLDGVKVDEDYRRYYPYGTMASKVLGFTGGDNQGIIGLEVEYEEVLKGDNGLILSLADAAGVEIENAAELRQEPVAGDNLYLTLDVNIQLYAQQMAEKVMEEKQAKAVSVIIMNPQNGEIYAMVNVPEFDLNEPYTLLTEPEMELSNEEYVRQLNAMWRNRSINDTYEPGSTFKMITASAALEEGVVSVDSTFHCPGFRIVEDRRIRCHKTTGHGSENFAQGLMNSCNPVFIEVGLRLGAEKYYHYLKEFGLLTKTGVDLPGEAGTIMHKPENIGEVELATMSFGQSFQITPMQLITTASAIVNGGDRVTPHFGLEVRSSDGGRIERLSYSVEEDVISDGTSALMRELLEKVVSEGGGSKGQVAGFSVGGKTATSEKLPRGNGKYISSFIGFAPADDPQVIALITIDEPVGVYYGGTIAAPVISDIFEKILPYLGISKEST